MNNIEEVIAFVSAFFLSMIGLTGIPGLLIWKHIETRNRERMAIIEKGLSAEEIRELSETL